VAVKPDLSTTKGTCGNPLPAKSEVEASVVSETSAARYHPEWTGTSCSPFSFHRALPNLCSYAHVFFTVIKINLGIVTELHLIQMDKNSTVPVLGYLQKRN